MKYEAVIFDFDGTMLDGVRYHDMAFRETLAEIGINITIKDRHDMIGKTQKEIFSVILKERGKEADIEGLVRKKHEIVKSLLRKNAVPSPGIVEFIGKCRPAGIRIGLASATESDILEMVLEKFGIIRHFGAIIGGEMISRGKPDPEMIIKALERLDVEPRKAISIDDALSGIAAARKIGMFTIAYTKFSGIESDDSDLTVKEFSEIDLDNIQK